MDLEQLLTDLKAVVRDGQDLLRASVSTMKEQARAGVETTGRFVQEKPYQTLGVAFGVGLLAGLLVASALKSEPAAEED